MIPIKKCMHHYDSLDQKGAGITMILLVKKRCRYHYDPLDQKGAGITMILLVKKGVGITMVL